MVTASDKCVPVWFAAKTQYGTSLANVDWLHGTAESLLTVTNLLIVLGLRQGIREAQAANDAKVGLLAGRQAPARFNVVSPLARSVAKPRQALHAGLQ